MNGEALLAGRLNGERLELAAGGEWTADNAAQLDQLVSAATPATNSIRAVDIDMSGIVRLDTYGAWRAELGLSQEEETAFEQAGMPPFYFPVEIA